MGIKQMDPSTPWKILLLEDEAVQRAGICQLVARAAPCAEIFEASSFEDAIFTCRDQRIDIAFLDYDLKSEKTGLDVLEKIRGLNIDTRVIMLSSFEDKSLIVACLDAGASGYVMKSADPVGLFEDALKTIFEGKIFLPKFASVHGLSKSGVQRTTVESLGISGRKLDTLYYLCRGLSNKRIALIMGVSEETIRKDYNPFLFRLFGVSRRTELMFEVSRRGVIIPEPILQHRT